MGVWCAVSSKSQAAEDKSSLQDQEDAGRRFAAEVGELVAVYRVPGHSRTMWRWEEAEAQMPAYRQLRQDVEDGRLDVLWCLESSRLGRDAALVQQVVSLLEANGAELYRADAPHVVGQKSTGHRFLDAFGSVIAQQEGELKVHRHRSGMRARVRRGLFPGLPPFGYRKAGEGYEQTAGADAVRMVTRLYLEGHSISGIRRRMNASGHRPQRAKNWSRRSIYDMMKNDAYAGYPSWGAVQPDEPSPFYKPIWDADTFAAVLRERERRYTGPYVRKGAGPLTGVVFCARCGYRMVRQDNGSGTYYMRCPTYAHRNQHPGKPICHSNYIREDGAMRVLSDYIAALATDDTIDRVFMRMEDQQNESGANAELQDLRQQVADLDSRRERLALAYAAGDMALAYYRRADDQLEARQETARQRVSELERYLASLPDLVARKRQLRWLFEHFDLLLERAEPAMISKAIQEAGFRVLVEEGTGWIEWE